MSVEDHGIEVLKKSGELVTPGYRGDYYIKVGILTGNNAPIGPTNPVYVTIVDTPGVPTYFDYSGISTPGVEQTLIADTVAASTIRAMSNVVVSCRAEGIVLIKAGGAIIGSGRTGPAHPVSLFTWSPKRDVAAGVEIKVLFTARSASAANSVEAYVQASDRPI